jgi:hypothetical protein
LSRFFFISVLFQVSFIFVHDWLVGSSTTETIFGLYWAVLWT